MEISNAAVDEDYRNALLTKYFGVVSFTVLVWDHIDTFSEEVELIWKGAKGPFVYLFFLNRYLIPLSFIVGLWAYFRTSWTLRSSVFGGAMTMTGLCVVELMMFFRIRALYRRVLTVQAIILSIFLAYVGVNSWLLTRGIPVRHTAYPLVDSCTMIIDPHVGPIASATAWLHLLYGTVVLGLTLFRTARALYSKSASQILRVMLQEGLLYYSGICAVTLTLTIVTLSANQSVRDITAQLELCLTVTMMSRITLRPKRFAQCSTTVDSNESHWRVSGRRRPSAARLRQHPRRVLGTPWLAAPPRATFPPGLSASVPTPSGTFLEGESFALERFSAAETEAPLPKPSSGHGMSVADLSVPVDLEARNTLTTMGDAELAGCRGGG